MSRLVSYSFNRFTGGYPLPQGFEVLAASFQPSSDHTAATLTVFGETVSTNAPEVRDAIRLFNTDSEIPLGWKYGLYLGNDLHLYHKE